MSKHRVRRRAAHRPPSKRVDKLGRTFEKRQQQVFAYIVRFAVDNMGHMPTLRDIGNALEIDSTSTVHYAIDALVKADKLRYQNGFLVIPGSKFEWREEFEEESVEVEVMLPDAFEFVGGGDRPHLSHVDVPGRLVQETRS